MPSTWSTAAEPTAEVVPRGPGVPWLRALTVAVVVAVTVLAVMPERVAQSALPPPVLDGSAGYRFVHVDGVTGRPARFNPCAPVGYVVNPVGAPERGIDDVQEAFRRAEIATGIRFVYEGTTAEVPARGRAAYQPEAYGDRWAPVLVGWIPIDPADGEGVKGAVVGWASHSPLVSPRRQDVVVTGTIALDRNARSVRPGFGAGRRWGNVVLHEIGHLLGLDHAPDAGEVMATTVDRGAGVWGPGDLAGLLHLGREAGCLRVPAAGHLEVIAGE
jgi:hypothetical protein